MEKKILSFDAGIRNLAYCLLHKYKEKIKEIEEDSFNINKWDIINLMEDECKCDFIIRGGGKCNNVAKFCIANKDEKKFMSNNDNICFNACKSHADKFVPTIEEFKDCQDDCCMCKWKAIKGIPNTEYRWCIKHSDKAIPKFLKRIHKKKVGKTSYRQSLQVLANKLFSKLDEIKEFMDVDEVLIENQPSLRNPTMKTIASMLYSYFVMRGITDKDKTNSKIKEVKFISPSQKLKINKNTTNETLEGLDKKSKDTYNLTKELGIEYCKSLINEENKKHLETYKKQDDLCDAFLQGFQYLFSPVPDKYVEKLKEVEKICPKKKKEKKEKIEKPKKVKKNQIENK